MKKKHEIVGEAARSSINDVVCAPVRVASMMGKAILNPVAMNCLQNAKIREASRHFFGRALHGQEKGLQVSLSTHGHISSKRSARLFIPKTAKPGAPLVVMLHGCMQDSNSFASLTGIDEQALLDGFCVLHPDQESSSNALLCWNWSSPENQKREGGEPEALADLIKQAQGLCKTTSSKTRLAGISAGGALASTMAHLYPELMGAIAVIAGPAPFTARDLPEAMACLQNGPNKQHEQTIEIKAQTAIKQATPERIPVLIVQGEEDKIVHPKHGAMQEFSALTLNAALAMKACVQNKMLPAKKAHLEGSWGSTSLWTTVTGELIALIVRPKDLTHAWSGGSIDEAFAQKGFNQTKMLLNFFEEAEKKGQTLLSVEKVAEYVTEKSARLSTKKIKN